MLYCENQVQKITLKKLKSVQFFFRLLFITVFFAYKPDRCVPARVLIDGK